MTETDGRTSFRRELLGAMGARGGEIDEVLGYASSRFTDIDAPSLPLGDEPFVAAWRIYQREASGRGVLEVLREKLVQLRFPVREGVSQEESYRAATRRGIFPDSEGPSLELNDPNGLRLLLHKTAAGAVPALIAKNRPDFVTLVQALSEHNEPAPVPASMGALTVSGISNWDRIGIYRRSWEAEHPAEAAAGGWKAEFARLVPRKELYQDRLIILSEDCYSGTPPERVGMTDEKWRAMSLAIRLEHECVHYLTKRLFGSMNKAIHDEFIADYAGIAAAAGAFRADWLLLFLGLEDYPRYRRGGRLENYLSDPPPGDAILAILRRIIKQAAENVERFEAEMRSTSDWTASGSTPMILALAGLHMDELASQNAGGFIADRLAQSQYCCFNTKQAKN